MGFLKKITRPISRVLDKIVPNEIKPALPFLAAAVPFLAPQAGIFGTMAGRGLLSGGANLLSQLSQEGSEGDFNALSLALASGIGALSGGGPGKAIGMDSGAAGNTIVRSDAICPKVLNPAPAKPLIKGPIPGGNISVPTPAA